MLTIFWKDLAARVRPKIVVSLLVTVTLYYSPLVVSQGHVSESMSNCIDGYALSRVIHYIQSEILFLKPWLE
jgi:hypothetical protein